MAVPLILGTQSKRRIELLSRFTVPFRSIHSNFDELSVPFNLEPEAYVRAIAKGKNTTLRSSFSKSTPILTADTTVYYNGIFFNKPEHREEAFQMLSSLQGQTHQVWTGLTLSLDEHIWETADMTEVEFHPLNEQQILQYIDAFSPLDKAGSYAIQDAAGLLVKKIHGDYYNVVGFPLAHVVYLLNKIGINLWEHLRH